MSLFRCPDHGFYAIGGVCPQCGKGGRSSHAAPNHVAPSGETCPAGGATPPGAMSCPRCGHAKNEHAAGLPGCVARIGGRHGEQCECPMLFDNDTELQEVEPAIGTTTDVGNEAEGAARAKAVSGGETSPAGSTSCVSAELDDYCRSTNVLGDIKRRQELFAMAMFWQWHCGENAAELTDPNEAFAALTDECRKRFLNNAGNFLKALAR